MTDLDKAVRQHYKSIRLERNQIDGIIDSAPLRYSRRPPARWLRVTLAAGVLLAVVGGVHSFGTTSERTQIALREAAMNHTTKLNLEFVTDTVAALDRDMDQLPFPVTMPEQFDEQFAIVGARYCSMRGNLAAHLKLVDRATDKHVSLFMTPMAKDFKWIGTDKRGIEGVDVQLWHERGMFYALAEAAS